MEAREYAADDVLRGGAPVWIRAIRADDKAGLAAFHQRLSPESVYMRCFEYSQVLSPKHLRYLTEVDFDTRVALVATLAAGPESPNRRAVFHFPLSCFRKRPSRRIRRVFRDSAHIATTP